MAPLPAGVTAVTTYSDGTVRGSDGRLYKEVTTRTLAPQTEAQYDEAGNYMGEGDKYYSEADTTGGYTTTRSMQDIGEDPIYTTQRETAEYGRQQATLLDQLRTKYRSEEAAQRSAFEKEQAGLTAAAAKEVADAQAATLDVKTKFEAARGVRKEKRDFSVKETAGTQLKTIERMAGHRAQLSSEEDVGTTGNQSDEEELKVFGRAKTLLQKLLES